MDIKYQPMKDDLMELSGSVSKATDAESLRRAMERLTEYLTRQKEQQDREHADRSSLRCW
jgi:hypothetical protein